MGVGMMHTINQRIILRRSQRENPSWWIKQYHTWGHGQAWWTMQAVIVEDSPGWALHLQLSGWLAHEWANASEEQRKLWNTNKGTLWRWSIKEGGDLYFKSGKDACMSSNLKKKKNICTYFWIVTGKSLMRSSKMVEKERSIVVMIIKNRFWSWNKRTMGWTLPLGKSQRNE